MQNPKPFNGVIEPRNPAKRQKALARLAEIRAAAFERKQGKLFSEAECLQIVACTVSPSCPPTDKNPAPRSVTVPGAGGQSAGTLSDFVQGQIDSLRHLR